MAEVSQTVEDGDSSSNSGTTSSISSGIWRSYLSCIIYNAQIRGKYKIPTTKTKARNEINAFRHILLINRKIHESGMTIKARRISSSFTSITTQ